jgi:hypothetical protein
MMSWTQSGAARRAAVAVFAASALLLSLLAISSETPAAKRKLPKPPPSYWGAWIGSQMTGTEPPEDMGAVAKLENLLGKPMSIVEWSNPWANCHQDPCYDVPFPAHHFEKVRQHGAIPFYSWASQSTPPRLNQADYQLSDVASGRHDAFIRKFATDARNWGHPFFLRFNWEMNGDWFAWGERANGNQPGDYVAAWRHVHDIFTSVGATNASWVWCPYVDPKGTLQPLASLYPGNAYVDWTCLDGFNWGPNASPPRVWRSFDYLFGPSYHQIVDTIAPTKPMVIGEIASTEAGGSKAGWITNMFTQLGTNYTKIRGLLWFEKFDTNMDWPIETSTSATNAFAKGIANRAFKPNLYPAINSRPIPPPG